MINKTTDTQVEEDKNRNEYQTKGWNKNKVQQTDSAEKAAGEDGKLKHPDQFIQGREEEREMASLPHDQREERTNNRVDINIERNTIRSKAATLAKNNERTDDLTQSSIAPSNSKGDIQEKTTQIDGIKPDCDEAIQN